jgi:D-erythronate 2-dehydrogenase
MTVLVTGAFGLVGSATVKRLVADGQQVVATDLDLPAHRKAEAQFTGAEIRYADLTDAEAVDVLVSTVAPTAIVHLAAVIAPHCYRRHEIARKVNVDGTGYLVAAAAKQPNPPRFVLASSIAVYGPRNPHQTTELLTADTPVNPYDIYGAHKVEAEGLVRESDLDWLILRLGGVLFTEISLDINPDFIFFEGLLPTDGRLQTVDVRDVARAFAAAAGAPGTEALRETLLIGGDDQSHRHVQGDVGPATAAAMGLVGGIPTGRKGDPASATNWFATDWMDTTRSQEVLAYQHYSFPDILIETAAKTGWKRHLFRIAAPVVRQVINLRAAYRNHPGSYADPWGAIEAKWGDPRPADSRA